MAPRKTKNFVEGERLVPTPAALRTYRDMLRPDTVGVVCALDGETTAWNQVRIKILDEDVARAVHRRLAKSGDPSPLN